MRDIVKFLEDNKVDMIQRGSQVSRGWVGICCPYCGDDNFHLGFNKEIGIFSCWRCGTKPLKKTLHLLTGLSFREIEQELKGYFIERQEDEKEIKIRPRNLELPKQCDILSSRHKQYLEERGFDAEQVEKIWSLKGIGKDAGKWSNRIIIPIFFNKKLVSFTSRDITGEASIKALTCPEELEVIHAKHIVHGFDLVEGNSVIVTEGPFDSMKFGPGAVDTQGIKFTEQQISLLGAFRNIFICFDSIINDYGKEQEKAAQEQAEKLADSLSINCNVWIIDECDCDPGDMTKNQIKRIKKEIQKKLLTK